MMQVLDDIKKAILPSIEKHLCYLDDIVYENEGNEWYLRIFIGKIDGILDMEVCVAVSEEINEILDTNDFIKNEYYLEVSSPGAEKTLKSFEDVERAVGKYIYVKLKDPKNGKHEIYGHLLSVNGTEVLVEYKEKNRKKSFLIDYQNIRLIRLAIEF